MIRWGHIANAILAQYAGTEAAFVEADSRYAYDGGTNRIVAYPVDGTIEEPSQHAYETLADLAPSAIAATPTAVDDIVFERHVNAAFEIWAPTGNDAENRLHALLVAIAAVLNTTLQLSSLRESWPQSRGDIVSGGTMVVLSATFTVLVLKSDARVVSSGAAVGEGTPTTTITSTEIDPSLDDEAIAPATEEIET